VISPVHERSRIEYSMRNCPTVILEPEQVIEKAVEAHGDKLAVSCSFGSCSVVALHMALKVQPDVKVVFNNTGVAYPETYAYRDLLVKEWNLNLIETKPIKSFWRCVKEYGFPLVRAYGSKKKKKEHSKPKCCIFLKELPMKNACIEFGIEGTLTGMRCAESGIRMFVLAQRGQYYHTVKWGSLWRYHPIGFWTHKQVFDYLRENRIPVNEIYSKGRERSGCMPCTSFLSWERQLAKTNLKMYKLVQKMRKVPLLDDFIQLEEAVLCESKDDDSMEVLEAWT